MPSVKTVAIVGAGPGGLCCAHKLLKLTPFSVTIFEKASNVGGLWERNSLINPEMQTNFCRFTASFSDLAWESVDLGRPAPVYPKAWMVEKYLQDYAERYIPARCFQFETCVTRAEKGADGWRLAGVKNGEDKVWRFDYLVVAAGYLSTPKQLECEMDETLRVNPSIPILHSTKYRNLEQIFPYLQHSTGKERRRILMVGGSHSGSDISTLIAWQASDARWGSMGSKYHPEVEIIHVMHNPMHAVPGVARNHTSPTVSFHPLEFTLCERSSRGPSPISFSFALSNKQVNDNLRMFCKAVAEGELGEETDEDGLPPYAIMSETYASFVEARVIKPTMGVLKRLSKTGSSRYVTATVQGKDGSNTIINDIAAVVNATGFDSCGSLSFLSEEVKRQLEFDPTSTRLPLVLDASYMAQHSSVPDIALLGFTPVNWGIMEMQSRAIAAKWAAGETVEDPENIKALAAHMRLLREALKDPKRRSEIPHFLFSDYLGIMEQAGRELHAEKINGCYGDYDGFVCAARYVGRGEDRAEAVKTMDSVQLLERKIREKNYLLAKVTFSSLLGKWVGKSQEDSGPEVSHVMEAHPRYPTSPRYDLEYVLIHRITSAQLNQEDTLIARYSEADDEISMWFVEPGPGWKTGERAFTFNFDRDESGGICASARLAVAYVSLTYSLEFRGSMLHRFRVTKSMHDVPAFSVVFERPSRVVSTQDVLSADIEPWTATGVMGVKSDETISLRQ